MIEAFERHLNNTLFEKKALKARTLDEQIEFCKRFLLEHDYKLEKKVDLPPFSHRNIDQNYVAGPSIFAATDFKPQQKVITSTYKIQNSTYQHYKGHGTRLIYEAVYLPLMDQMAEDLLKEGFVKITEEPSVGTDETVFTAKMGVFKP